MNRTFLILAGALLAGGIALMYVYMDAYIEDRTGGTRVLVVTAARDIPFGEPMEAEWLTVREIPQGYVEDRHLRSRELRGLIGVPLAQAVRSGEAILRTDLSTLSDQQRTLSGEIPPGMRALGVEARPESSHAGLLRPGDRVDVLLTVGDPRIPNSARSVVVAQNILVLAVGRAMTVEVDEETGRASNAYILQVSLEVRLEDAQRLTLSRRQGEMRILLRNPNDASTLEEPPVLREGDLFDRELRGEWLRRFALAERPPLPPDLAPPPAE